MLLRGSGRGCRVFVVAAGAAAGASALVAGPSLSFAANPAFSSIIQTGSLQNASITEASGIAASRMNPNVLWTHNDSGHPAQIFATTPAGASLGTYNITGAASTDWEDIAVGPGPTPGQQYVYAGDIGDNDAVHPSVAVYRIPEPTVSDSVSVGTVALGGAVRLDFTYPNGPHDAESLFVDPLTKDIYIISKRDSTKYVYRAAYPQSTTDPTQMELVISLSNANWITGADISPDGDEIIMRSYAANSGLMYIRPAGGTIKQAFQSTPISIPLASTSSEVQGEAIGFGSVLIANLLPMRNVLPRKLYVSPAFFFPGSP